MNAWSTDFCLLVGLWKDELKNKQVILHIKNMRNTSQSYLYLVIFQFRIVMPKALKNPKLF